jgi:Family of unknown function (DUF5681)
MDPVSRAQTGNNQDNRLSRFGDKLKQWPKGTSGNPSGRPKRKFATKVYAELFRDKEFRAEFKESVRKIMTAGRGMAPVLMAREVAERLEGKPVENIKLTGELGIAEVVRKVRERKEHYLENAS